MAVSSGAKWFPHDVDALGDDGLIAVVAEFGLAGYGAFWALVELMARSSTVSLRLSRCKSYAYALRVDEEWIVCIIKALINERVFQLTDGSDEFTSERLLRELDRSAAIAEKRRAAAKARWNKGDDANASANAEQVDSRSYATNIDNDNTDTLSSPPEGVQRDAGARVEDAVETKSGRWPVTTEFADALEAQYPGLPVRAEIAAACEWTRANPAKRPKVDGRAFIRNWLSRSATRHAGGVKAQRSLGDRVSRLADQIGGDR